MSNKLKVSKCKCGSEDFIQLDESSPKICSKCRKLFAPKKERKIKDEEIPVGKMPQKLEEDLCDAMENLGLYGQQIAEMSYDQGFKDGYKKAYKLN